MMTTTTTASRHPSTIFHKTSLLTLLLTTPIFAHAETLSLATQTSNHQSVVIYTAKPLTTPAPSDLPLEIWAAANGLLSEYYPSTKPKQYATQSWPQTLVINGLTLEVQPGEMPTLSRESRTSSSTVSTTSGISTKSTSDVHEATSSATPRDDDAGGGSGDRTVGIVIGVGIIFIALAMLLVIMCLLWRRKNSTGTFFKPARYSLSSVMTETIRGRMGRGQSWISPMGARQLEKEKARRLEQGDEGDIAPSPTIYRVSTIRAVDLSSPPESTYSSRPSVERLRSKRLVSRGMWTEVKPHELEGDQAARAELSAESPTEKAAWRKTQSSGTLRQVFDDGETTPKARTARPLVVTMSPTTSSSDMLASRDGQVSRDGPATSSSGQGESRDEITPIVTPIPSYRDRRPPELLLPSANNRFRDQRLAPLVHFQDDHSSPGVSPLYRSPGISNSPSPNFRTIGFSPSPSPHFPERRVSPMVHYPSFDEVRGFEFNEGDSTPRRPSYTSLTDGGDGWQPGGDNVFGRYEMA
ncbi:hypothetical protein M409DRAFT_58444 [Zasmidium cellare ATCC 36951]|uniref:Mid2 domain-containing protein n=1 Tax=Zasmidium cellare ATCC 36951 TaxID=1080233 RepID=A0A6A6C9L9_ZASCE|nr:uncharacterized protein M409DRAFT_58444 [Zasmidium cellare ATCC 36951]KAF2162349.1 hypothetical protein M409DRAFT_58444 [Zasmidium cellare ATCC 36951]